MGTQKHHATPDVESLGFNHYDKDPFFDTLDLPGYMSLDDILAHPGTGITEQTLEALKNDFLELKATGLISEDMTIKAYWKIDGRTRYAVPITAGFAGLTMRNFA